MRDLRKQLSVTLALGLGTMICTHGNAQSCSSSYGNQHVSQSCYTTPMSSQFIPSNSYSCGSSYASQPRTVSQTSVQRLPKPIYAGQVINTAPVQSAPIVSSPVYYGYSVNSVPSNDSGFVTQPTQTFSTFQNQAPSGCASGNCPFK